MSVAADRTEALGDGDICRGLSALGFKSMGYPMSFRRVLNRNRLSDGDYEKPLTGFAGINTDEKNADTLAPYWRQQAADYEVHLRMLCGDLRRLERDAVDENATCKHIAERTGLDIDTVAAVLKEFIAW